MIVQLHIRRSTTTEWETYNTVLAEGEPGLDSTLGVLKVGDGVTPWSELPIYGIARSPSDVGPSGPMDVALTGDQTVNNSTTLVNSGLTVSLEANAAYVLRAVIGYVSTASLKLAWSGPSGMTGSWTPDGPAVGETTATSLKVHRGRLDVATSAVLAGIAGTGLFAKPTGYFQTGGTGGDLTLQFAQNAAGVSDTTLQVGSTLSLVKIV